MGHSLTKMENGVGRCCVFDVAVDTEKLVGREKLQSYWCDGGIRQRKSEGCDVVGEEAAGLEISSGWSWEC